MKKLRVAACMLMLALAGCDNNDNAPTAVKKDAPSEVTKAASSENASSAKLSVPERQKLAQQSAGKVLTLLDLSEVQLDGAATLVLTFSIPLDPDQDFSRVIHVVDKKSGKVDGAWELSDNLKELRLRHLEPKRDLIVTIGKEVKALNNATFSKDDPDYRPFIKYDLMQPEALEYMIALGMEGLKRGLDMDDVKNNMLDIHLAAMETLEEQLRAGKLDPDDSS